MSLNLTLIFESNVQRPFLLNRSTPTLLERCSVIAPVVASNSIGMLTFLKKVSLMLNLGLSTVVPSPLRSVFMSYVLSIRVLNRLLFARLLKDW